MASAKPTDNDRVIPPSCQLQPSIIAVSYYHFKKQPPRWVGKVWSPILYSRPCAPIASLCSILGWWREDDNTTKLVPASPKSSSKLPRNPCWHTTAKQWSYHDTFSFCPISHATLWAWFNITKLLANLLIKPSVFLLLCQLYFVILFQ